MARYWTSVHKRAWRDAAKTSRLDSRESAVMIVLTQSIIGLGLWFALGNSALQSTVWGRVLTAASPFFLFPLVYLWKLFGAPSRMANEAENQIASLRADTLDLEIVDHSLVYKPNGFAFSGDPLTLIVKVRNPGAPTIVSDWKLHVLGANGQVVGEMRLGAAAWDVYRRIGQSDVRIDISREPLAAGAEATAILVVFSDDKVRRFCSGRRSFRIECEDVRRRQSKVDYTVDLGETDG